MPIIHSGQAVSVVMVDMRIDVMHNFIKDILVFDIGELTLLNQDGNIIGLSLYGVSQDIVKERYLGSNIEDLGWWDELDLLNKMKNNERFDVMRKSYLNRSKGACYFVPIKITDDVNCGLIVQVPMKKITHNSDVARNISIVVSVIVIIVLIIVIKSIIVKPIGYAVGEIDEIAKGNLTKESNADYLKRGDEIGILINAFDKMKRDISSIISWQYLQCCYRDKLCCK